MRALEVLRQPRLMLWLFRFQWKYSWVLKHTRTVDIMRILYINKELNVRTGKVKTVVSNVGPQPTVEQAFAVSVYLVIGKSSVRLQCVKGELFIKQLRIAPAPDMATS